jgi:hypothetical protein
MQTLSMANVPWYFCKDDACYRIRPGYRLPGADAEGQVPPAIDPKALKSMVDSLVSELNRTVGVLTRLSEELARRPADR